MPLITVEGPVLTSREKKRQLIITLTAAATQIYELPREAFTVLIKENPPENVGLGGKLLIEMEKRAEKGVGQSGSDR